jgi:hypothetical protein
MNEPGPLGGGMFELGDVTLQSGTIPPKARLTYKTHGGFSGDRKRALGAIKAKATVMAGQTDL